MSDLQPDEIQFIKELSFDPRFKKICETIIDRHGGVPRFNGKPGKTSEEKHDNWVYRSGIDDGIQLVLKTLGYEH